MKFETEINFQSNTWNRDAWARIQADLNSEKESICYTTGTILGVTPGQAVKELCGFETFLCTRLMPAAEDRDCPGRAKHRIRQTSYTTRPASYPSIQV